MTIIKLTLVQKRNYRYEQTETSFHVNEEVAKKFAKEKIAKGFDEIVNCNEWGNCTRHIDYYENYHLDKIFVNEG